MKMRKTYISSISKVKKASFNLENRHTMDILENSDTIEQVYSVRKKENNIPIRNCYLFLIINQFGELEKFSYKWGYVNNKINKNVIKKEKYLTFNEAKQECLKHLKQKNNYNKKINITDCFYEYFLSENSLHPIITFVYNEKGSIHINLEDGSRLIK